MNLAFDGEKPYKANGQFNWKNQTVYVGFNYRFGSVNKSHSKEKQRDANGETQGKWWAFAIVLIVVAKENPRYANSGFLI
jgi:hypothetical protein